MTEPASRRPGIGAIIDDETGVTVQGPQAVSLPTPNTLIIKDNADRGHAKLSLLG